jgi:class 3 adenylate cyclase
MLETNIASGMRAWERHDWATAYEELLPLLDAEESEPGHLEALAESAWWCGSLDDTIAAQERAFKTYSAAGRNVDAAGLAIDLAEIYALRLQPSAARGWMARASRLLEDEPATPALGNLRRLEAVFAAGSESGLQEALELALQVEEIGRDTGDRDVEVLGLHDQGRFSIASGDVGRGMALMEESMVSVLTGELGPRVTGRILCNMIDVSASMADYRRAGEWSDQAMRWCEEQGNASGFPGICRIRRSEMMRLRGAWSDAEAEASRAADELGDFGPYMAAAFNELGMIHLNLGDREAAEEAFRRAHSLGSSPMPGIALLKLSDGDATAASSMIESALDGIEDLLTRAKLLPSAIEISLAANLGELAERYSGELTELAERFDSDLLRTFATQGSGRIAYAERRHAEAVALQRTVVDDLVAEGLPYEAARARCDLAMALTASGSPEMGKLELDAATDEFEHLGARTDLARIAEMSQLGTAPMTPAVRTMMFTDIVDSTSLIGAIGDDAWADLISWHDRTLRDIFVNYGGDEVNHTGDGFFATFDSPDDAARCAIEIQRTLRQHRKDTGFAPKVRIGIHSGPILEADGELVGQQVHLAARIGSAAAGEEILLSHHAVVELDDTYRLGDQYDVDAKGIAEPVTVAPLDWK